MEIKCNFVLDYNKQEVNMKKILFIAMMLTMTFCKASAQAEIKFDKLTCNLGTFSESTPVQKCIFTFTNIGNAPLVINQAIASCGCTVPQYTKRPIAPGEKGTISVTYNGRGKYPGYFKKTITLRTNGKTEMTRIYIEGTMEEAGKQ